MQGSEVRRGDVEALRDLLKDPAQCLDKLVADGLCETHRHCSHCGSGEVRRSQCQRGVRKGHFFVSCAKCHKYTNCLFYSKELFLARKSSNAMFDSRACAFGEFVRKVGYQYDYRGAAGYPSGTVHKPIARHLNAGHGTVKA
ncbi:unnamed protein product [Symbiodinium necroappetens]|uniref:Uncharacterized protein n=1 Tax=Symbiodinium necroappetens TaxID=1628268 RepID=A0A812VPQ3_9DINO|nr:unnamed protein product [Symbiodinium necroappetens]